MTNPLVEIVNDLKGDWTKIETTLEGWEEALVSHAPSTAPIVAAVTSDLKQAASDAITLASGALSDIAGPAATAISTAAQTALAAATGGLSAPLNPAIENGVDTVINYLVSVLKADGMAFKASLAANGPAGAVQGA